MKVKAPARIALCLVAWVLSSPLYAQTFSEVSGHGIPALTNSKAEWVDFNNDNLFDLFISGTNSSGGIQTGVYINNGNNTFNSISLTALSDLAFDFADYNHDGFIDIITSGVNASAVKKTILYKNSNGTGFAAQSFSLTALSKGGILWTDLDHDADADLILTGINGSNEEKTLLYEFSDGQYLLKAHTMVDVSNGEVKALDANNDDKMEVIVTGLDADGVALTTVYTFNDDLSTEIYSETLAGAAFNSMALIDADGDSYQDIFTAGLAGQLLAKNTAILKNNGTNDFIDISNSLTEVSGASVNAADLNNDGKADLIISGIDNSSLKYFNYYINDGDLDFTAATHSMPNIYNGAAALADYDNDGDVDVYQIGNSDISFQSNLFLSDQAAAVANAAPSVPANLEAVVTMDSVYFTWDEATDDLTSAASLTYNIYISTDVNGDGLVVTPLSDIATGFRRTITPGNTGYRTFVSVRNLPEGRYYWSVQAIDNSFKGSVFASEESFAVCLPVSLGNDTTICNHDVLELSMGTGDDEVNWYSTTDGLLVADNTSLAKTIVANDTLIVEVTRSFNCTITDTIQVTVSFPPALALGTTSVCKGQEFEVEITNADSVNWFNPDGVLLLNSSTFQYTVDVKDTIIAHAYNEFKCVSKDSAIVDVLPLPDFSIGMDQSICFEQEATFEISGTWQNIQWSSLRQGDLNETGNLLDFLVVETDTIIATVTDANNCVNYDSAMVTMLELPEISLGEDRSICYLQEATVTLSGSGFNIRWLNIGGTELAVNVTEYQYQVLTEQTTIVEVTDEDNCVKYDSLTIGVLALPEFNIGADTAICYEQRLLLETGSGFERVDWLSLSKDQTIGEDTWFYLHDVIDTDTLVAVVHNTDGCVDYDTIAIAMLPLPIIELGDDLNVCFRDTATVSVAGSWDEVNWYTHGDLILAADEPSYSYAVEETMTIWTEVFDIHRCVSYDTINVQLLSLPQFDLGDARAYCKGDPISIAVAEGSSSYEWKNASGEIVNTSHEFASVAESSDHLHLTVTDEFECNFSDDVVITVNALPDFEIAGDHSICEGDTLNLSVAYTNMQSILWSDLSDDEVLTNNDTLRAMPAESTSILVTLVDQNDCENAKEVEVIVFDTPVANAGLDQLICYGESVNIGSHGDESLIYSWVPTSGLNSSALATPAASPLETIKYALKVTSGDNCSSLDSVLVEVNPQILVDAGTNVSVCIGDSVEIGGTPTASGSSFPYTYEWLAEDSSLGSNSANPVVAPVKTTKYYVLVTSGKCSVEIDSIDVTVNPLPVVTISEDQSIGAGSSVTLHASGGEIYVWSPAGTLTGAESASPTALPQKTTRYVVHVTDLNQCTDTASVKVYVQNNLFIPNVFSPNGDERNDVFRLYGSGIKEIILTIFDQKGNQIFRSSDVQAIFESGWDGTDNGKKLKDDVYIWTIDGLFYSGEKVAYEGKTSGIIKLMR